MRTRVFTRRVMCVWQQMNFLRVLPLERGGGCLCVDIMLVLLWVPSASDACAFISMPLIPSGSEQEMRSRSAEGTRE